MSLAARAITVTVILATPGCYLAHERGAATDAGRADAFVSIDAARLPDVTTIADAPCAPLGTLVRVDGMPPYGIEATEVTREAYARFVSCAGAPSCAAHPECVPDDRDPRIPMRCTSACEAAAYCAWAGRRLCTVAEWLPACRATADRVAPGDLVQSARACVLSAYADDVWGTDAADTAQPVMSAPLCRGATTPFDAVFDTLGNVSELVWVDPSEPGPRPLGYSYTSGPRRPCTIEGEGWPASQAALEVGFRCCAD